MGRLLLNLHSLPVLVGDGAGSTLLKGQSHAVDLKSLRHSLISSDCHQALSRNRLLARSLNRTDSQRQCYAPIRTICPPQLRLTLSPAQRINVTAFPGLQGKHQGLVPWWLQYLAWKPPRQLQECTVARQSSGKPWKRASWTERRERLAEKWRFSDLGQRQGRDKHLERREQVDGERERSDEAFQGPAGRRDRQTGQGRRREDVSSEPAPPKWPSGTIGSFKQV